MHHEMVRFTKEAKSLIVIRTANLIRKATANSTSVFFIPIEVKGRF